MAEKPTYEALQPGLEQLEKEASSPRLAEQALKRTDQDITTILDTLLEHVVYQDTEMNILWANQAACNSVGMTRQDLIGRHCYEVWASRQNTCEDCPVARARDTGKAQKVEKMTPDRRWWHIAGYPVRDDSGHIKAMVELTLDITERRRAEEDLRQKEGQLHALLTSISDHMSMMDKDFNIIWANEKAIRLFGNDIIGKKCYEVYHRGTSPCEPQPCSTLKAFKSGKSHTHTTEVTTRDGISLYYHCTANVALRDSDEKPTAVLEISRDVTKEKKLESELRTKAAELDAKSHSLEETNTALRVLLKQREADKAELEEKVLSNVKHLVLPYVERLKKTSLDNNQMSSVDILQSNLKEIISPFSRKLSSKYLGLTPTEIRVANLIKDDKTTKEIAEFMNMSEKTVETHRAHIRRKIGIKHKKVNLKTYLSSLQ
jgi:PAS domain S-box-containing protein